MNFVKRIFDAFVSGPVYVFLFGLVFFGIGAGLTYKQYIMERNGVQAPGEVTSLAERCDNEGCTYLPIVRFKTSAGKTITFESSYSSSPPAYHVGEEVVVIYHPDTPEKADIKGEGALFRIIFMIVGGIVLIFGFVMFLGNVKHNFSAG